MWNLMIWFFPSSFPLMPTNGKLALSLPRLPFQKKGCSLAAPNVTENSFCAVHKYLISLTKVVFPFKGGGGKKTHIDNPFCLLQWEKGALLMIYDNLLNKWSWDFKFFVRKWIDVTLFLPVQVQSGSCNVSVGVWGYNSYQNLTL